MIYSFARLLAQVTQLIHTTFLLLKISAIKTTPPAANHDKKAHLPQHLRNSN
uniref:Uncharacterized protein n=1 Tax=Solanum tuberosum TaxID=4113 RepID=M1BWQ4_SOLTU